MILCIHVQYLNYTSVMQGIFGASLISHYVAQGVLFALHVANIQLHTDSSSGCMACTCTVGAVFK